MNMLLIDWAIVIGLLVFLVFCAHYTKRYTRSVADFLAANRCARRYILAVAGNSVNFGAITIIAWYEMYYQGGFGATWWLTMMLMTQVIVGLTGWLVYRFRQTRAMTLSQFFEMRYSKRFRIFSGILAFISGVVNFGIAPAVGARFFIYFCGLPGHFSVAGVSISTFAVIMLILLSIALYFIFAGGQIAVMVTDFIQGTFTNIVFIIIIVYMMTLFDWSQITEALLKAPADASLVHPFHAKNVEDFDMWYFLIGTIGIFYNYISWQGSQGYRCSAINPKEQKVGQALNYLRSLTQSLLCLFVAICVYTAMHHSDFSQQAADIERTLGSIDSETIRKQMLVPVGASLFLKNGLFGGMCAIMLAGFITSHDTYMHSWGSIFIQDVILPFRKKPFTPKQHIRLLRFSILGVAVFIFFWSLYFPLKESIFMYFAITGAIYLGGAGAVIIGGLYWKKGTTTAAWWTMTVGSILAVSGIVIRQIWPHFPVNSQWMFFITMVTSCSLYVGISLLGRKADFDLDRMLHRSEDTNKENAASKGNVISRILEKFGIEKGFTRRDKLTYAVCFGWTLSWIGVFIVGVIYNVFINRNVSDRSWLVFWWIWVILSFIGTVGVTIWLTIGGIKDVKDLFNRLASMERDNRDDGTVVDHHNLDEQ